jgi:transcriptional regulator with XRE-family HTH domain
VTILQQRAAACLHSKAAFHCSFATVAERRDISFGAKLLHALLVSQHRLKARWTQAELAERIGAPSRQAIWRLTRELEAAGLLVVRRIGLQQPNEYTVLGVEQDDLDGSRRLGPDIRKSGPRDASRARTFLEKRKGPQEDYTAHVFYGSTAVRFPGG